MHPLTWRGDPGLGLCSGAAGNRAQHWDCSPAEIPGTALGCLARGLLPKAMKGGPKIQESEEILPTLWGLSVTAELPAWGQSSDPKSLS